MTLIAYVDKRLFNRLKKWNLHRCLEDYCSILPRAELRFRG